MAISWNCCAFPETLFRFVFWMLQSLGLIRLLSPSWPQGSSEPNHLQWICHDTSQHTQGHAVCAGRDPTIFVLCSLVAAVGGTQAEVLWWLFIGTHHSPWRKKQMPGMGGHFCDSGFPQSMRLDTNGLKCKRRKFQKISGSQKEKLLFYLVVPSLGIVYFPDLYFFPVHLSFGIWEKWGFIPLITVVIEISHMLENTLIYQLWNIKSI